MRLNDFRRDTTHPVAGRMSRSEIDMIAEMRAQSVLLNRRRKSTRNGGDQTRRKILDAAEVLFGRNSFDSVSLRDITGKARVTLALASYHFGSKEALFEAVVARRADVLCRMRQERLHALRRPMTRDILDAFIAPLFEKAGSGEPGWEDYLRVLTQLGAQPRWLDLLSRHFDETAQTFLAALKKRLPQANPRDMARVFTMILQVMLETVSQHRRVDVLTGGTVRAGDLDKAYPVLLQFAVAGIESFNHPRAKRRR